MSKYSDIEDIEPIEEVAISQEARESASSQSGDASSCANESMSGASEGSSAEKYGTEGSDKSANSESGSENSSACSTNGDDAANNSVQDDGNASSQAHGPKVKQQSSSSLPSCLTALLAIPALGCVLPFVLVAIAVMVAVGIAAVAVFGSISGATIGLSCFGPLLGTEAVVVPDWMYSVFLLAGLLVILVPIVLLCYVIRYAFVHKAPKMPFWVVSLVVWIVAVLFCVCFLFCAVGMGIMPLLDAYEGNVYVGV